jgi:hypothetical protein
MYFGIAYFPENRHSATGVLSLRVGGSDFWLRMISITY